MLFFAKDHFLTQNQLSDIENIENNFHVFAKVILYLEIHNVA